MCDLIRTRFSSGRRAAAIVTAVLGGVALGLPACVDFWTLDAGRSMSSNNNAVTFRRHVDYRYLHVGLQLY